MPLSVAILAQTSLARESRTVAAMPRMPQTQLSLPASSVAAPAPAMAAPMEQSPRRPVPVRVINPMTKPQIVEEIALQHNVAKRVVSRVLDTIASKLKENLLTGGTLRLAPLVSMKIETKPPRREYQKRNRFGKFDYVEARPTKNVVRAFVTRTFRNNVRRGKRELSRGDYPAHTPASNALSRRFFITIID